MLTHDITVFTLQDPPPSDPITIRARGDRSDLAEDETAGSLSSSFGSPGSDLAELRDLKRNFSNQEELLGQLRDALQSSSRKEAGGTGGDYASRLAQMRSARRAGGGPGGSRGGEQQQEERGGRMKMLRKQLDESKVRQEEELRSRQELEQIVTGLQRELEERDQVEYFLENISVIT